MEYQPVHVSTNTLKADMYYKNTLVLRYEINYPWIESESFKSSANRINQHYTSKAYQYRQHCENDLYESAVREYEYSVKNGYPVRMFEAVVNFTVTYNANCTLSLYFESYEFTGGAHGMTVRYSDTWDMQNGSLMPLRDFIPAGNPYIIKTITAEAQRRVKEGSVQYFDDYKKNIAENFNPENFYINDSGVVIYFQLYDIAAYVNGFVEFTIPYSPSVNRPKCF